MMGTSITLQLLTFTVQSLGVFCQLLGLLGVGLNPALVLKGSLVFHKGTSINRLVFCWPAKEKAPAALSVDALCFDGRF